MKKTNLIFFLSFMIVWLAMAVINVLLPDRSFSENENRALASRPSPDIGSIMSNEYMSDVNAYLSDQFLLRDTWIDIHMLCEYAVGRRDTNDVYISSGSLISDVKKPDAEADEIVEKNIEGINAFTSKYKTNSSVMIVPSASFIQEYKLPYFVSSWDQQKYISDILSRLQCGSKVDVSGTLLSNKNKYIYYRTDHHWTTYGAYLAFSDFLQNYGIQPFRYDGTNFSKVSNSFKGTLLSKTGAFFIQDDSIDAFKCNNISSYSIINADGSKDVYDSLYFDEYLNVKDKYAYFLGKNQAIVDIQTNAGTGRRLVIFKDSYSHCFAPMLTPYFDSITLIDLRYINRDINSLVDLNSYTDSLFLYSIDIFTTQKNPSKLSIFG